MTKQSAKSGITGFSLLELLIVLVVVLVVGTMAIPNMLTVISNSRLRGGITSLSGLLQNCRILAIKENTTKTTRFAVLGNGPIAYVKDAADMSTLTTTSVQVQMGAPLTRFVTPSGAGAPPSLTTAELTFAAVTTDPSFNSRGLPCAYLSGSCTTSGFVYYFRDTRPTGRNGWAAVSVSPAGRIKRWVWHGSAWGD